jgi:hypothetical protein
MSKMRQPIKTWKPEWDTHIQEVSKKSNNADYVTVCINDLIDDHNLVSLPEYQHVTCDQVRTRMQSLGIVSEENSTVVQFKKTGT